MTFTETKSYERLDLEEIRRENPLPEIVAGSGVDLKPSGREWKACCPFHSERTPSFFILSGGERAYCHGCGWTGDVLDFVQDMHGVGLRQAAQMLGADTMATASLPRVALPKLKAGPDKSETREQALAIWRAAQPIEGTLAETYCARVQSPASCRCLCATLNCLMAMVRCIRVS